MNKILFILKEQASYNDEYSSSKNTGLFNSCIFLIEMLNGLNIDSFLDIAQDANDIERLVVKYKPSTVIIEALWATPTKLTELALLYPNIQWIVRVHSDIPFLANEGIAMGWIMNYITNSNIYVAFNNSRTFNYFDKLLPANILYLPNWYPVERVNKIEKKYKKEDPFVLNIGCFGAIRPMKNQLLQACAAVKYARQNNIKLNFHMNTTRIENNGFNILKNIRELFNNLDNNYNLCEHEWESHEDFLKIVDQMDIGMQVSFSETFNIVTADFVSRDIPIVVSDEIEWVNIYSRVADIDIDHIIQRINIRCNYDYLNLKKINKINLLNYNEISERIWFKIFGE